MLHVSLTTGQPQLQTDNQDCEAATRVDPKNKNLRRRNEKDYIDTVTIPSVDEVASYMEELGFSNPEVCSERFVDHYEAIGWMIGSSRIRDWKAKVREWKRRERDFPVESPENEENFDDSDSVEVSDDFNPDEIPF